MNTSKNTRKKLSLYMLLLPFSGIIFLEMVVRINAIKKNYVLYSSVFVILMLALILITASHCRPFMAKTTKNNKTRTIRLNPLLLSVWTGMCVLMLISDLLVFKKYCFLSLILLILFTGFYIIWQRFDTKNKDVIFKAFLLSIEISFIAASIFCFLFRPVTQGIRYSGLSSNPNVYGLYIITVWACLISKLDNIMERKLSLKKSVVISIELGVAAMFMYMTGARTSFFTIGLITIVWFALRLVFSRKSGIPVLRYAVSAIIVATVAFFASMLLLTNLPDIINRPVVFERDRQFTAIDSRTKVCLAASEASKTYNGNTDVTTNALESDIEKSMSTMDDEPSAIKRLINSITNGEGLDSILNGRWSIYKSYIKKLNFKGHHLYGKKVNGSYVVHAHNNVIQIAYSYGILSAVLYILLCVLTFIYSIAYYVKFHAKRESAAFPMLLITSFLISTLTEFTFIPMQSLLAFAYLMCVGKLMITFTPSKKPKTTKKLKTSKKA